MKDYGECWGPVHAGWPSTLFGRNGGPGDRNFDAGPSQDLTYDPFSWFEPGQKTSKCEHSKNHINHAVVRPPKCTLFDTSCFKNLLLTKGKVHIAKMHIFVKNFDPPHFCTVFSTICGTLVEETKKHRRIEIRFLGPLGPF